MLRSHITGQPFLHTWNCTAIASMQARGMPLCGCSTVQPKTPNETAAACHPVRPREMQRSSHRQRTVRPRAFRALATRDSRPPPPRSYPHVIAFFGSSPAWSKPLHIAIAEAQRAKLNGWVPCLVCAVANPHHHP
jgi:hypothetical protein